MVAPVIWDDGEWFESNVFHHFDLKSCFVIVGIYKIENLINHKCYIGQAKSINKRWKDHRNESFNIKSHSYNYPLYRAIRKYGLHNFSFEILEQCCVDDLNSKEIFYIKKYNSFYNGYNQTFGGDTTSKISKNRIIGIIKDLELTNMTHKEIAKKWSISQEMVQGINTGRYWKQDRVYPIQQRHKKRYKCVDCGIPISRDAIRCVECHNIYQRKTIRPNKEELYNLLTQYHNFTAVGNLYNVSSTTIVKWCKLYQLPHYIQDYK